MKLPLRSILTFLILTTLILVIGPSDRDDAPRRPERRPVDVVMAQGSPHWQREYFARLHAPYPAQLSPEHLERIWAEVLATPGEARARSTNSWELVGPSGMLVDGAALHSGRCLDIDAVTGSQTVVAAASGGLWRYQLLFPTCISGPVTSQWIGSFAIDPADDNTMIVGTGESFISGGTGVWKTTDGGDSWDQKNLNPQPWSVFRIRYGLDGTTVHAATMDGYYRSSDSGETWTRIIAETVTDLAQHPTDPLILYAPVWDKGLFLTIDGGLNWGQATNAVIPTSDVTTGSVSVCAASPGVIYAAFARDAGGGAHVLRGVYKTTNYGSSWTDISPPGDYMVGQGWYNNQIAVCPTDPDLVLAGGVDMMRSEDGGATWVAMNEAHLHGDHHAIQWHPNGLYVWAAHDGGWSYSQQQGAPGTWISSGNSLPITQFVHMDVTGSDWETAIIGGGSQDNGISISSDGGSSWWQGSGSDGGGFNIVDELPHIMYMASGYSNAGLGFTPELSVDGGLNWFAIPNGLPNAETFYPSLRLDCNNVAIIHYDHFVYEYDFGTNQWQQLGTGIPTQITEMTVSTVPGQRTIYVCADPGAGVPGQLWVRDQNDYFENRIDGLPPMVSVEKVVPHPTDSYRAYALMSSMGSPGEKVFLTTNRGVSWSNISGTAPYAIPNVAVIDMVAHPDDTQRLYLGTEFGYFRTLDGGANWHRWEYGLPLAVVASEMRYVDMRPAGDDLYIVSATYGRSIWKRGVSGDDPPTAAPLPTAARPGLSVAGAAPNPFRPATRVAFSLDRTARVRGSVLDVAGRRVRMLVDAELPAGEHQVRWDGRNGEGRRVPAGVYIVQFAADGQQAATKVTLLE